MCMDTIPPSKYHDSGLQYIKSHWFKIYIKYPIVTILFGDYIVAYSEQINSCFHAVSREKNYKVFLYNIISKLHIQQT